MEKLSKAQIEKKSEQLMKVNEGIKVNSVFINLQENVRQIA